MGKMDDRKYSYKDSTIKEVVLSPLKGMKKSATHSKPFTPRNDHEERQITALLEAAALNDEPMITTNNPFALQPFELSP